MRSQTFFFLGALTLYASFTAAAEPRSAEIQPHHVAKERAGEKTINGAEMGVSAPLHHFGAPFAVGEYLLWRADQGGMDCDLFTQGVGSPPFAATTNTETMPGKYTSGFRAAIGFRESALDYWEALGRYTQFFQVIQKIATAKFEDNEQLVSFWIPELLGWSSRTKRKWKLNFQLGDLELARNYFISRAITLRPHFGVRVGSIEQRLRLRNDGINFVESSNPSPTLDVQFLAKSQFFGVGANVGADFAWHFFSKWSLTGKSAGSLLYGNFDIKETVNAGIGVIGQELPSVVNLSSKKNVNLIQPLMDLGLGLQWESAIDEGRQALALFFGYELAVWFQQNQLFPLPLQQDDLLSTNWIGVPTPATNGNLCIQGFNFSIRYDF